MRNSSVSGSALAWRVAAKKMRYQIRNSGISWHGNGAMRYRRAASNGSGALALVAASTRRGIMARGGIALNISSIVA